MEFGSFPILTVSGFDILLVAECDKHVLGFIPGSWPTGPKTLSYKGGRNIFCSNEVAFAGSLASFRMGTGHQEDLGMVHGNLQSSPPSRETEAVLNGQPFNLAYIMEPL